MTGERDTRLATEPASPPALAARRPLRSHARGAAATIVDQGIVAGSNFVILLLLARRLPVEEFSVYVVALAVLNVLLGLHGALVAFPLSIHGTADDSPETARYIQGSGRLQLIQTGAFALVALSGAWLVPLPGTWPGILLAVGILQVPYQLNDYIRRLLLARHALRSLLRYDVVVSSAKLGAVFLLVGPGFDGIPQFSAAITAGFMAGFVVHFALDERRNWVSSSDALRPAPLGVARRNWPLTRLMLPEVVSYQAATQSFLVLSTAILSTTEVAVLGGLQAIANIINVFLAGVTNYGLVNLTRARHRKDDHEWRSAAYFMSGVALLCTGVCSLAFVVIPEPIIRFFYGADSYMAEYPQVLRVLGAVILARTASVVLITVFRSLMAQASITRGTLISGLTSVVIAGPFMMTWGVLGAVYGLLLSQLVLSAVLVRARPHSLADNVASAATPEKSIA